MEQNSNVKGWSIASMVLGICGVVLCCVPILPIISGTLAITFAAIGIKREGSGMAVAGLVTGIISIIIATVILVGIIFTPDYYTYTEVNEFEADVVYVEEYRNPIVGNWLAENPDMGYLEFTENEFRWFRSQDDLTDYYFFGRYTYGAGALRHSGHDYGTPGRELFTLNMTYLEEKMSGTVNEVESLGIFIIERLDSVDSLWVVNQREWTTQRFRIDRVI
ncbi:MAG: DUF4190 domain-containing protein [Oscillospiraceae bacterium]|nr:DUF4190 domain-containing protein [Oscillospiraceae bacterium]